MLKALESSLGVVTTACKKTDTPRSTYYKWLREDKEFADAVKDIENVSLDFAESKLFEQMANNNTSATIFYLKTKGKQIIPAGEHLLMELPGGGGYGDPAERDPGLREEDLANDLN